MLEKELMNGSIIAYECPPTKESALQWITKFQETSLTSLVIFRSISDTKQIIYLANLRCHHNVPDRSSAPRKMTKRDTACPVTITVTVARVFKRNQSQKPYAAHALRVWSNGKSHNHATENAAALKFRRVKDATRERLLDLFAHHHSPSTALETLKTQLQLEHGENYLYVAADRALVPDKNYVYNLYYQECQRQYPRGSGDEALQTISEMDGVRTAILTEGGETVIAAVTPLMERAHSLKEAGEVVFVDSSGGMDRYGLRIFLLMCWSPAGGLPLGVIISTAETEELLVQALELLIGILPEGSFGGRSRRGPQAVMTDDCRSERNALERVWPDTRCLLCVFHLLQAAWRWLFDLRHGINHHDRPTIMAYIKSMVYAESGEKLDKAVCHLRRCWQERYPQLMEYLQPLYARRRDWALYLRDDVPNQGHNTNNVVEAAFRVMKDSVLYRTRAFNTVQLVDFVTKRLSEHYARKLMDVANGRRDTVVRGSSVRDASSSSLPPASAIAQVGPNLFEVTSSDGHTKYVVDHSIGTCSCIASMRTGNCKHSLAVDQQYGQQDDRCCSERDVRKTLMFVATGSTALLDEWFGPLDQTTKDVLGPTTTSVAGPDPRSGAVQPEDDFGESDPDPEAMEFQDPEAASATIGIVRQRAGPSVSQTAVDFQEWAAWMTNSIQQDGSWERAAAAFMRNWHRLPASGQQSGLHRFGGTDSCRRYSTQIGVQPTSTARRTSTSLRGRARISGGRPCKADRKGEHAYAAASARRSAAPHSLATCVAENRSVGR